MRSEALVAGMETSPAKASEQRPRLIPAVLAVLQVSAQRKNFLSALQEEKESMRASHAQHLEKLRSEFEKQKQQIQHMQQARVQHTPTIIQLWCECGLSEKFVSLVLRRQSCSDGKSSWN